MRPLFENEYYRKGLIHGIIALGVLFCCYEICFGQPPKALAREAAADLAALPDEVRPTTKYLTLAPLPRESWKNTSAAVSFALNLVSRAPQIALPEPIAGGKILRINIAAYGLSTPLWESLVTSGEPYYHLTTQAINPTTGQIETVFTDGGWVGLDTANQLHNLSQSAGCIVRADWFLAKSLSTLDGGLYYELAGVTDFANANELYKAYGVDFAATDRLLVESWALVLRRGPTHKFGRVLRRQGAIGAAWKTEDYIGQSPDEDPFRSPLVRKHDGSEHFLTKSNGMPLVFLADGAGKFVRSAPDNLATDDTKAHGTSILAPALSCIVCHAQDFLQPVTNDFRRLLSGNLDAYFASQEDAIKAAAVYERDMQKHLDRDREDYADAVASCTGGLSIAEVGQFCGALYRGYVFDPVTPEAATRELGLPVGASLKAVLGSSRDVVILALCEGIAVQRQQWEASYAEAATLAAGVIQ